MARIVHIALCIWSICSWRTVCGATSTMAGSFRRWLAKVRTLWVMVAVKNAVWRSFGNLVGDGQHVVRETHVSIRSASSSTSISGAKSMRRALAWSMGRVATGISCGLATGRSGCGGTPPTTHSFHAFAGPWKGFCRARTAAPVRGWGQRTNRGRHGPSQGLRQACSAGSRKAAVLPVPVCRSNQVATLQQQRNGLLTGVRVVSWFWVSVETMHERRAERLESGLRQREYPFV